MIGTFREAALLDEEWRRLAAAWQRLALDLDPTTAAALDQRLWNPVQRRMTDALREIEQAIADCRSARETVR